jgi:chloride channel protein, CIC family
VIGNYSVTSLAPVGIASLLGYLVAGSLASVHLGVVAPQVAAVTNHDLLFAALLGVAAAVFGIVLMRGVYLFEAVLSRAKLPAPLRPAVGGVIVGLFAVVTPQVMSSGHGALRMSGMLDLPLRGIAIILVLKALASIVSLGSGFRGGLFFSSLLMGALGGQLFASAMTAINPALYLDSNAYAVIGMSALSAAVIGGPLTMIFVALESTGNLWLTAAVLIAVIISAQVTRELFGYSFAMAVSPARRDHPQRRRYRLAARSDRRPHDAQRRGRDRDTARATVGQGLAVSAFPRYVPV